MMILSIKNKLKSILVQIGPFFFKLIFFVILRPYIMALISGHF